MSLTCPIPLPLQVKDQLNSTKATHLLQQAAPKLYNVLICLSLSLLLRLTLLRVYCKQLVLQICCRGVS